MTCVTCGGPLEATDTHCPTCGELATATGPTGGAPVGSGQPAAADDQHATAGTGPTSPPPSSGAPGGGAGAPPAGGYGPGGAGTPPPGAYGPGPAGMPAPHPSGLSSEARGWAIGAHLGGLVLGVLTGAALGFLAPLLVWLLKRDEEPFLDHHGKEALNFQLTVLVALVVAALAAVPAVIFGVLTLGIGFVIVGAIALAALAVWIALPIMASVKASNGEGFRYPLTIRFVR